MTEERTTTMQANELLPGDIVMSYSGDELDRQVARVRVDNFGVWVTYTDGVRDSFPRNNYRVVVVLP